MHLTVDVFLLRNLHWLPEVAAVAASILVIGSSRAI